MHSIFYGEYTYYHSDYISCLPLIATRYCGSASNIYMPIHDNNLAQRGSFFL